jgi:hypothetical protein
MTDPAEIRGFAARCFERARDVTDPNARAAWLDMAANWLRIAGVKSRSGQLGSPPQQQQQQQIQPKNEGAAGTGQT